MARRRYRRYRRKTGKWSSNIQELLDTQLSATPGNFSGTTTLVTNPAQSTLGVSQIYTCKNFAIDFTIESKSNNTLEAITAYIMFVPQGMNVSSDYNIEHPEYIMNYKFLGSPMEVLNSSDQQYQPFRLRTRLSRKLNTGDSIILFIKGLNKHTASIPFYLSGLVRWWTKAN